MVALHIEHPTLRDRLRSGVAVITRAHPAALLLAVASTCFLAIPVLVAPLASFAHAIHADEAIAPRGDPDAAPKDGLTGVPGTAPPPGKPQATTPPSSVAKTGTGGSIQTNGGWGGWVAPRLIPVAPFKAVSRVQQEPASHAVRHDAQQRQARAMPTQPYHAQGRGPAYAGRSIGENNRQSVRPYSGNFNRDRGFASFNQRPGNFGRGGGWGSNGGAGGGGGWFHGGGRRR